MEGEVMTPFVDNRKTPNISCVYCITNTNNGRRYYGQTQSLKFMMTQHHALLKTGRHTSKLLQNDFILHKPDSFVLSVVIIESDCSTRKKIESALISQYKKVYN